MTKTFGEIMADESPIPRLVNENERLRARLRALAELADAYDRGTGVNGFARIARKARNSLCEDTSHE